MLIAYRSQDRAVFLFGFAKNELDNIGPDDLQSLRSIAVGRRLPPIANDRATAIAAAKT